MTQLGSHDMLPHRGLYTIYMFYNIFPKNHHEHSFLTVKLGNDVMYGEI